MAQFLLSVLLALTFWIGSSSSTRYNAGDHVPLFVNKVGPLHNPSETYQYYDLPFCRPEPVIEKQETLGEVLNGDRLMSSLYKLKFAKDKTHVTLRRKRLKSSDIAMFRDAIAQDYYFQMYYDDLPLWGFVGKSEGDYLGQKEKLTKYYLFSHLKFNVLYNADEVVEINSFSDPSYLVDISEDTEIDVQFTYSVTWNLTSKLSATRMNKYSQASLHPISQKIHLFSFLNSITVVVLLVGLLFLLFVRHLKNELRSCSIGDEEEKKEVGWKLVHSDVFRSPRNISLLCAFLGTGTQLLILIIALFALAFTGFLYPYNRGMLLTSLVIIYTLTSIVAGYTSASFHNHFEGTKQKRKVRLAGILYPVPFFIVVSVLNTVAVTYGATAALPFGTIVIIILIYTFLNIPFLTLGGFLGNRFGLLEFQPPTAIKRNPREIPLQNWYRRKLYQVFLGGFVPFSAVVLEWHQLYASLWGFKIYTSPGMMLFTFVVLIFLSASVGIILTYIQLSGEDHEWWWRSILCGGFTAIFMYGYGVIFYLRSDMTGFLQLSFYLGYTALLCYALFLVLGTISFLASWMFIRHIYRSVKLE
ncbi:PREDICTED: transmembrane 9 superfamily member 5 isoform X1 [Camelina sativa]|uniref:Transmembrane 9 superfamily member n=2 Tax=Camelina sativa TaxID=90675 RepID=A0ABM0WSQ8_CAMSA|nr:PREDICTED: transmembrane 9 superfamily member 5 isoform X1 [Camelina sativa]XP_010475628.1 PREDICTED: transmembrane 9 superfamily member 5 isoform X1 [Camelina sativa]